MLHLVLKIICLIDLIGCDVKHEPIQDRKRGFEWILLNALIQPCIRSNLNLVRQDFGLGWFPDLCDTGPQPGREKMDREKIVSHSRFFDRARECGC